jgi:hypothetical protein
MTPAEEPRFIALGNQGLTTAAIAERLEIPEGTARSRAYTLQQPGKMAARPKGGKRTRRTAPDPPERPSPPVQITTLPPSPKARLCAGTCGFVMPFVTSWRRWPPSGTSPGASWCRSCWGKRWPTGNLRRARGVKMASLEREEGASHISGERGTKALIRHRTPKKAWDAEEERVCVTAHA